MEEKIEDLKEEWKDVGGYEGSYQVSNLGRVRSLDRLVNHPNGKRKKKHKGKVLSNNSINSSGYVIYRFMVDGNSRYFSGHRLVAEAFIPNKHNLPQVNHIDGNPSNNNVNNLEWCDASHNTKHAYKLNLAKPRIAEDNELCKVTESDIEEIINLCNKGEIKQYKIAEMFNISQSLVSMIKHKKRRTRKRKG